MMHPMISATPLLFCAVLGASALAEASAQDPEPQEIPVPIELPALAGESQEELLQLFRDIEKNLRRVDVLLSDAGAGDTTSLTEVEEAGIGRLLENSRETSRQVLADIDRLLEIAAAMGQSSGSSSSSGPPQSGSSGSEGGDSLSRGNQTTQREQTPENPGGESPGEQPEDGPEAGQEPGGEQPGEGEEPTPQGQEPTSGEESSSTDPTNRRANDPPQDPTGAGSTKDPAHNRWGDLPVHVQDVFRGEDSEEMPTRYRDWIDAYYRRLNRRGGR